MHKRLVLAAALIAATAAMAQPAAPAGPQSQGPNAAATQPRLGAETISRADFLARAAKYFDETDANHDGRITSEEQRAGMQARIAARQGVRPEGAPSVSATPAGPGGPGAAARGHPEHPQALHAGQQDMRRPAQEKR